MSSLVERKRYSLQKNEEKISEIRTKLDELKVSMKEAKKQRAGCKGDKVIDSQTYRLLGNFLDKAEEQKQKYVESLKSALACKSRLEKEISCLERKTPPEKQSGKLIQLKKYRSP